MSCSKSTSRAWVLHCNLLLVFQYTGTKSLYLCILLHQAVYQFLIWSLHTQLPYFVESTKVQAFLRHKIANNIRTWSVATEDQKFTTFRCVKSLVSWWKTPVCYVSSWKSLLSLIPTSQRVAVKPAWVSLSPFLFYIARQADYLSPRGLLKAV